MALHWISLDQYFLFGTNQCYPITVKHVISEITFHKIYLLRQQNPTSILDKIKLH